MATNKDFRVKTGLTTGGNVTINGIATTTGVIQSTTGNTNQTYLQAVNTGAQALLGVESNVAGTLATGSSAYAGIVGTFSNTPLHITSNGIVRITVSSAGVITDGAGNELGFKNIPVVGNGWQRGKCNVVTTGTSVNTSAAGDTYSIFNNSTVAIPLTQTAGLTLYLGGTNSTGNRTILPHGFATIWYMDAATAVINGNVT